MTKEIDRHTLIIAEKPDAARRIATALDAKNKPSETLEGAPYFTAKRGRKIIVVPSLGHLYTLAVRKCARGGYPAFDFQWVPISSTRHGGRRFRAWLGTISRLAEDADEFVDGCDYDIEGSVIGYNILRYACRDKEKNAKRMKYSTLTGDELQKSFLNLQPHLDFALIEAGLARHEIDWLYGINLSRALTSAARTVSGKYTPLSTGRVQGPTLKFIAQREKSIRNFVQTSYWKIRATIAADNQIFEAHYEKRKIEQKTEAISILADCKVGKGRITEISSGRFKLMPPYPFDLGSLQSEAYRIFKYPPKLTSDLAQRLYLDALISYPRTNSQKLPPSIGYESIIRKLHTTSQYGTRAGELLSKATLKPIQGRQDDPAHPAIYPTGDLPIRLHSADEMHLLDLIVKRFLATFAEPAAKEKSQVTIDINGHHFYSNGNRLLTAGWLLFYDPYSIFNETILPSLQRGQRVTIHKVTANEESTEPPPRYNAASLVRKMERAEIGTKSTRANTVQILYKRKYVKGDAMVLTGLGFEVLGALEKHSPDVLSSELTRNIERKIETVRLDLQKRKTIVDETIALLKPILRTLKENERELGKSLSDALLKASLQERRIGKCPVCKKGDLVIIRSNKTGKRFVGCTGYYEDTCKASFPLPQKGNLKPLKSRCYACQMPMIQVSIRDLKKWKICINPCCPAKRRTISDQRTKIANDERRTQVPLV